MKKFLLFFCTIVIITSCTAEIFTNYDSYAYGTWRCSSKVWCPNDSIRESAYTMEITDNDYIIFRRNNQMVSYKITKFNSYTYSDYAISYELILSNNDTIKFGSASRPDPDFSNIVVYKPIAFFSCKNEPGVSPVMHLIDSN